MKRLILLALFSSHAHAGPYLELGISKADGWTCIEDQKDNGSWGCSESPLGSIAIGYSYKGFSAEVEHYSSLLEKDKGLNLFSIKYRIGK